MIAVLACKLCRALIRLLGRGGTDFPGRVALKLCPNLLGELAKNVTTVIVTGTNGKTTTSRMIEQSWQDAGISYFANKSGANLLSGVTAEFAVHSTLTGRCKYSHALIEADEAALKFISKYVDAKVIVYTNIFRDQLDRYGEITHTLNAIREGITHVPNATLCLNADDSLITSLHDDVPNPVIFYGVSTPIYAGHVAEVSDAPYCIKCKSEYEYDFVTYGHLGGYRCWEEARECLRGNANIRFDTSSSLPMLDPAYARKLIEHYGVENCMFGTDFPMWEPTEEFARFMNLGFGFADNQRMLSGTFKEWFGL